MTKETDLQDAGEMNQEVNWRDNVMHVKMDDLWFSRESVDGKQGWQKLEYEQSPATDQTQASRS